MINKTKLLNHIEKEFNIKTKAEHILYYICFEWRNDSALEIIEVYIGSRTQRLNNNIMTEFEDYVLVYSDKEIYLLSKELERRI